MAYWNGCGRAKKSADRQTERTKGTSDKGEGLNCGAAADAVEGIAGRAAVDPEPAVAPTDARHAATAIARTRAQRPVPEVQVAAARPPLVPQLEQEALEQGVAADLLLGQRVGREVLVLLIGFHAVAEALGVRRGRSALVLRHGLVQVIAVGRGRREASPALGVHAVERETLSHEHRPAEAARVILELDAGQIRRQPEDFLVELLPLLPPVGGRGVNRSRGRGVEDGHEVLPRHDDLEPAQHLRRIADTVHHHHADLDQHRQALLESTLFAITHGAPSLFWKPTPITHRRSFLSAKAANHIRRNFYYQFGRKNFSLCFI